MQLDIRLDLTAERVQRHLLEGLDIWVRLGLLSQGQVRELAAKLSEPVRLVEGAEVVGAKVTLPRGREAEGAGGAERAEGAPITDFLTGSEVGQESGSATAPVRREPGLLGRAVRSLLDEISVIWLLFLGVFLVVVSSGVLAASQWQSFSAVGQYAILFTYTFMFWGASVWAQRQAHLQTTAKMLALTTLLLIPVNFWMMDELGVFGSPLGVSVGGLGAISLTVLPFKLLTDRSNTLNLVGLSWLHWGWGWGLWPLIATYLGTVGTAANLTYQDRLSTETEPTDLTEPDTLPSNIPQIMSFDSLTVALSILILLTRSLWMAQVPPHQLGLASGICGWLLVWLTRNQASQVVWSRVGLGLLLIGWAVSVGYEPPWQAIGVSGLALWLIWDRLRKHWLRDHLLMLLGVAFQAYWLLWFTIPAGSRANFLTGLSNRFANQAITGSEWASLGLFPFVIGLLIFAWQLRRRWIQLALANHVEIAALVMGGMLSLLSLGSSFTAVVNLSLSTVTLVVFPRYRAQIPGALVELTHGVGLLALVAWIHYMSPDLSVERWAYVGLGIAIAEFLAQLIVRSEPWRLSTWRAGLVVAAIDYGVLLFDWDKHPHWLWLTVPVVLTLVANHRRALQPQAAVGVTMAALVMQGPWLTDWGSAITSFAIGTLCMGLNSRIWRNDLVAMFTVASVIGFTTSSFGHSFINPDNQSRWLIFWAIEICLLWLVPRILSHRPGELAQLYSRATQIWGFILMIGLLLWVTLIAVFFGSGAGFIFGFIFDLKPYLTYGFLAALLLTVALGEALYHRPTEWRFWSMAWATELVLATGLLLRGVNIEGVAISTIALGLLTQIGADLWVLKRQNSYRASWHGIPVAYGLLGWLLGHIEFQADTGLYTLA
ncbi:MAG: hypothetical protein AAGC54_04950, partial [Cyanobacteria bacterium P01_F01_bin.4]